MSAPFGVIKKRLSWLSQRQPVLARNIANADTPGYVPHDLQPLNFAESLRRTTAPGLAVTAPNHLRGSHRPDTQFSEQEQRDVVESTPNGNSVDLEQQMAKLNETAVQHKLATQLYRSYLGLVRTAAGSRG